MTNRVELAKNYLVSVAERTIGVEGFRREYNSAYDFISPVPGIEISHRNGAILTGLFLGTISQLLIPTCYEARNRFRKTNWFGSLVFGGLAVDYVTTIIPAFALSNNLTEGIAIKLLANVATHVGLDVLSVTAQRFRNFKPSATTLANL
ncbi:hypothetical protein HYS92_01520 [Candidatus Daviesbacteria bacterium]|nr:hypothetical protein [Candidatus Daviesbacteria bacterium]